MVIRTLRGLLKNQQEKYENKLKNVIDAYNNSFHETLYISTVKEMKEEITASVNNIRQGKYTDTSKIKKYHPKKVKN